MDRRTKIFKRYLKALETFMEANRSKAAVEVRHAHSLNELATLDTALVIQTTGEVETEELMVVIPPFKPDERKFFCSGWARKAGLVNVPALENR